MFLCYIGCSLGLSGIAEALGGECGGSGLRTRRVVGVGRGILQMLLSLP